jgi:hypothetical protein
VFASRSTVYSTDKHWSARFESESSIEKDSGLLGYDVWNGEDLPIFGRRLLPLSLRSTQSRTEDVGRKLLRNVSNYLPINKASGTRTLEI